MDFFNFFKLLADQEAEMEANLEKMLKNEDETEDKATKSSGKDNSTPPKENVQHQKHIVIWLVCQGHVTQDQLT